MVIKIAHRTDNLKIMNKPLGIFSTIVAVLMILILGSFAPLTHNIVGEWKGTDKTGKSASFILDKTNHLTMVMDGKVMSGLEHEVNGRKVEIKYEFDESKKPIWLDFVFYFDGVRDDSKTAKGIIRFISDSKIELRMDFDSNLRFEKFDPRDKENTIMLTRT